MELLIIIFGFKKISKNVFVYKKIKNYINKRKKTQINAFARAQNIQIQLTNLRKNT